MDFNSFKLTTTTSAADKRNLCDFYGITNLDDTKTVAKLIACLRKDAASLRACDFNQENLKDYLLLKYNIVNKPKPPVKQLKELQMQMLIRNWTGPYNEVFNLSD